MRRHHIRDVLRTHPTVVVNDLICRTNLYFERADLILSNATKYTPPGGRIEVLLARRGGHVVLSVTDTGQGIAADFLPHVFDRFRQADSSTTGAPAAWGSVSPSRASSWSCTGDPSTRPATAPGAAPPSP